MKITASFVAFKGNGELLATYITECPACGAEHLAGDAADLELQLQTHIETFHARSLALGRV